MPPSLPLEIIQEIFYHVQEQEESLVSWSLVCHDFCDVARQAFFKEFVIGATVSSVDTLSEILQESLQILPYIEVLSIAHPCKLGDAPLPVIPYPNIAPILDLLYDHADNMTELRIAPRSSRHPWSHPPSSWYHFHEQTQSALLRLLPAPKFQSIHIEGFVDIPARVDFDLPRLTQFTVHNGFFHKDPDPSRTPTGLDSPQSNLRVLQISGGDVVGTLRWMNSQDLRISQLERLSIASTISYTLWSAADMTSVQRLITSSCASLVQVDIRLDDYDHGALPGTLDLSHLTQLHTVTSRIQYFCDASAYLHLPSPTPALVSMLSTLPAEAGIEIKLTFAVQFLSVFSALTIFDLDTLDSALDSKKAKLHIWVIPNVPVRFGELKVALETQLPKLHGQRRLYIYNLKERHIDCRYWLHQRQAPSIN